MAEFQWWLFLVGLVAGGAIVAVVSMETKRTKADLDAREREAMTSWIADRLVRDGVDADAKRVAAVLAAEDDYLALPPPDAILPEDAPGLER